MDTWGDLFERATEYETSVEAVRESLSAHRETRSAAHEDDA
jgi:hypothetical protein